MLNKLVAEYEDEGTIAKVKPYLMWQSSPPGYLFLGQWSSPRDHIAFYIDEGEDGKGVMWWAWRFVSGTEGGIERLTSEISAADEVEARVAAELWARKNFAPVKSKARTALSLVKEKAVKKGEVMPVMPWYRAFMVVTLIIATAILVLLMIPQSFINFALWFVGISALIVTLTYYAIDKPLNIMYGWAKKGKYIMKEVK